MIDLLMLYDINTLNVLKTRTNAGPKWRVTKVSESHLEITLRVYTSGAEAYQVKVPKRLEAAKIDR